MICNYEMEMYYPLYEHLFNNCVSSDAGKINQTKPNHVYTKMSHHKIVKTLPVLQAFFFFTALNKSCRLKSRLKLKNRFQMKRVRFSNNLHGLIDTEIIEIPQ